jgi:hypothetical protein
MTVIGKPTAYLAIGTGIGVWPRGAVVQLGTRFVDIDRAAFNDPARRVTHVTDAGPEALVEIAAVDLDALEAAYAATLGRALQSDDGLSVTLAEIQAARGEG